MPTTGFVVPILPGKESLARESENDLKQRAAEHAESRRGRGWSVERAYLQKNPDGSAAYVVYLDHAGAFPEAMGQFLSSDLPIDKNFLGKVQEATGIDFRAGWSGPPPELIAQWIAPGAGNRRAKGFAFAAPLQPGKTDQGRAFGNEAFVQRRAEMTESRLAKRMTREEIFLNQTPSGDMVVVYLEGEDPVQANRDFASSNTPFDRWFKDRCKEIFPPYIDFNQPVPPNEEMFSWQQA